MKIKIIIIDYKLRKLFQQRHKNQIKEYRELVKDMYPDKNIQSYLIYLDNYEIQEIKEMKIIQTYSTEDDFIDKLSDSLYQDYIKKGKSLRKVAIIFGGRRPSLFLKKSLSEKIGRNFYPPTIIFKIDDFMWYLLNKNKKYHPANSLNLLYDMYQVIENKIPYLVKDEEFVKFLPYIKDIIGFFRSNVFRENPG